MSNPPLILELAKARANDVASVGGKNASLGELISQLASAGVRVPGGFATTAEAFREFIGQNALDERIAKHLARLDTEDVSALAKAGKEIRGWVMEQPFPASLQREIETAYEKLAEDAGSQASFAVRSSATA